MTVILLSLIAAVAVYGVLLLRRAVETLAALPSGDDLSQLREALQQSTAAARTPVHHIKL